MCKLLHTTTSNFYCLFSCSSDICLGGVVCSAYSCTSKIEGSILMLTTTPNCSLRMKYLKDFLISTVCMNKIRNKKILKTKKRGTIWHCYTSTQKNKSKVLEKFAQKPTAEAYCAF